MKGRWFANPRLTLTLEVGVRLGHGMGFYDSSLGWNLLYEATSRHATHATGD